LPLATEGIRGVPLVWDAFNVTKVSVETTKTALPSGSFAGLAIGELSLEQTTAYKQYQWPVIVALLVLTCLSLLLRTLFLGNTFQSSDNAELAFKILKNDGSGYWWILREYYGALINVYVKLFVGLLSFFDVVITEFWWKFPIAAIGSLQAPLTYFFLKRRIGCSNIGALAGAAFISILPIHVFESRYLWGYEVLAVFFVTLAIWGLTNFFEEPTAKAGLLASVFAGLYLISHGYIIPFIPCLISIMVLFGPAEKYEVFNRFTGAVKLCARRLVWIFPLLLFPLCVYPLGHSLRKPTRLGFYLQDHLPGFIENVGYFLALLLFTAVIISLCSKVIRSKYTILFTISASAYLAPLFFGTPSGITVIRGYMLIGTYFLLLCATVVLDKLIVAKTSRTFLILITSVCFFLTSWGTVESIFGRDALIDPSGIKIKRGGIPADPGSKGAGFLVRKYVKSSEAALAIHGAVEPPNLFYYFARSEYSFFDLSPEQAIEKFYELKDKVDVVICDEKQASIVEADGRFVRRSVIISEHAPSMLIYTRPHVQMPVTSVDVRDLNEAFDREYAWSVRLK
jgi:hypothetical protein